MHHERIAIIDYGCQYTRLITRRLRDLGAFGLVYGQRGHGPGDQRRRPEGRDSFRRAELGAGARRAGPGSGHPGAGRAHPRHLLRPAAAGPQPGRAICTAPRAGSTARPRSRCRTRTAPVPGPAARAAGVDEPRRPCGGGPGGLHGHRPKTPGVPVAAMEDRARRSTAIQFHPEVTHTTQGAMLLLSTSCTTAA